MTYLLPILILFIFLAGVTIWQDMRIDELEGRYDSIKGILYEKMEENVDLRWKQDMEQISIEGVKENLEAEVERLEERIDYLYDTGMQHKEVLQLLADEFDKKIEKVDELQLIDKEEE